MALISLSHAQNYEYFSCSNKFGFECGFARFCHVFASSRQQAGSNSSNSGLHIVYCIVYESKEEQVWCAFWMKNPSLKVHKWENLTENWINRWWIWMFGMNNAKPHLKHWIIEMIVHHILHHFQNIIPKMMQHFRPFGVIFNLKYAVCSGQTLKLLPAIETHLSGRNLIS